MTHGTCVTQSYGYADGPAPGTGGGAVTAAGGVPAGVGQAR